MNEKKCTLTTQTAKRLVQCTQPKNCLGTVCLAIHYNKSRANIYTPIHFDYDAQCSDAWYTFYICSFIIILLKRREKLLNLKETRECGSFLPFYYVQLLSSSRFFFIFIFFLLLLLFRWFAVMSHCRSQLILCIQVVCHLTRVCVFVMAKQMKAA